MADRPQVPDGVRLLEPPDGSDPSAYWDRVRKIRYGGTPFFNACKLAREEALGVREVGGARHRPEVRQILREQRAERLASWPKPQDSRPKRR